MKKALLLRQQVPQDKERITFNSMSEIDDMWIFLFDKICENLEIKEREVWMWGSNEYREVRYSENLVEKWFPTYPTDVKFDFIFSRGGFSSYIPVMQANVNAFKLYYGAIYKKRLNPKAVGDTVNYDLLLADSQGQYEQLKNYGYNVHKFIKPACENIFKPVKSDKQFDVVFIGNAAQKSHKGHEWFLRQMAGTNFKILQIGNLDTQILNLAANLKLKIQFTGYIKRKFIPEMACKAKVGVCCSTGDSCPRIIPEYLAMGLPVVIRKNDGLSIWNCYQKENACFIAEEYGFKSILEAYVNNCKKLNPRKVYDENFSIDISAKQIADKIKELHA